MTEYSIPTGAKVLSVTEPYPTLIMEGTKLIETRSWKTNYRGWLYIHASSTRIKKEWRENKELMGLVRGQLHFGEIVCKCRLVDCVRMTPDFIESVKRNKNEYICGFYEEGRYAWILADVQPIDLKKKVKGNRSIWTYKEED